MSEPKINPITGLEETGVINPITGLPVKSNQELASIRNAYISSSDRTAMGPAAGGVSTTGDFSDYSRYGVQLRGTNKDYEDLRARNQGALEKLSRGVIKGFGATAPASFINSFVGMVGFGDYALSSLTDSEASDLAATQAKWARLVDTETLREAAKEKYPHYYTREELSNIGTLDGYTTMNFLTDKVFDGLGFFVGTAASLYATGGLSTTAAVGRGLQLSNALASWRAAKTLRSGKSVGDALKAARTTKKTLNWVGNKAAHMEASFYSSLGEASLEGRETGKMVYEKLKKELIAEKTIRGEDPVLTALEEQQIKLQAAEAEGAAFYANSAILTLSNSIMFANLLKPFRPARLTSKWLRPASAAEKAAVGSDVTLNVVDRLSGLPIVAKQLAQASRFAAPLAAKMITEGGEEAMQFAITEAMTEYELSKLKDSGTEDVIEALFDSNRLKLAAEMLPQIGSKALDTFNNPEAREQFVIGALIGAIGGGKASYNESQGKRKARDTQMELFNTPEFYQLAAKGRSLNSQSFFLEAMNAAEKDGNQELYEFYKKKLQATQILQHYEAGSLDLFREMMEDTKSYPEEEFKKLFGFEESEKIDQKELVDNILETSKEIEKSAELVDALYNIPKTKGAVRRLFMSEEQKTKEEKDIEDQQIYKGYLKNEIGTLHLIGGAIKQQVNKLEELFPGEDLTITVQQKNGRARLVNMKERLTNYARNKFGEIVAGEEEGTQAVDVTSVSKKLLENLSELVARANVFAPAEQAEAFRLEAQRLIQLIQQKDNAATALRNLLRDPATRDLAISRAKFEANLEKQRKIDVAATKAIDETVTAKELEDTIPTLEASNVSPRAIENVKAEIRKRNEEVSDAINKWNTMSKSEVANESDLSPILEKAREEYLQNRVNEEPEYKVEEEARKRRKERQEEKANNANPGVGKRRKGAEYREGIATSEEGNEDAILTTVDGKRELQTTEDGKVIVDINGSPIEIDIHSERTVDGKKVITNPELAASELTKPGTEVRLLVIEDSWWNDNKGKYAGDEASNIPIYVELPGKGIFGVLIANDSPLRRTVYEYWKEGKQGKEPSKNSGVIVKVAEKKFGNYNNARVVQEDGTTVPYFYNANTLGTVPIGVVVYSKEIGGKEIRVGNIDDSTIGPEEYRALEKAIVNASQRGLGNLRYGNVVAFIKNPNGEWNYTILTTAKLNEEERKRAFDLIRTANEEDSYIELVELVGLNVLEPGLVGESQFFLNVEEAFVNEDRIIRFALPEKYSKGDLKLVGSITTGVLNQLVEGTLDIDTALADKKIAGNLIQEVERDEEGRVDFEGTAFDVLKKADRKKLLTEIPTIIKELLYDKRRQISVEDLDDLGYFKNIADQEHSVGAESTSLGFKGIIATDLVKQNGSFFHSVGIRFESEVKVDGKAVDISVEEVVAPEAPRENDAQAFIDSRNKKEPKAAEEEEEPQHITDLIAGLKPGESLNDHLVPGGSREVVVKEESKKNKVLNEAVQGRVADDPSIQAMQTAAVEDIIRPGEKGHPGKTASEKSMYYHKPTDSFYPRVSSIANNFKKFEPNKFSEAAIKVGNQVDSFVRLFFEGQDTDASGLDADKYPDLVQGLELLRDSFTEREESVYATNLIVPNLVDGYFGEMDIITVDSEGVYRIYDIKTMKNDFDAVHRSEKSDYIGENAFTTPFKIGEFSKEQEYSRQLSLYRIGLAKSYGIVADSLTIVAIQPTYKVQDIKDGKPPSNIRYLGKRALPIKDTIDFSAGKKQRGTQSINLVDVEKVKDPETGKKTKNTHKDSDGLDGFEAPFRLSQEESYQKIDREAAEKWLQERNIPVDWYDAAIQIGSSTAHGYMHKAAVNLWNKAEVGTEYHESFHYVFRVLLNDAQRKSLYNAARRKYAASLKEKGINPSKATDLQLEEEMAEGFRDYVLTEKESEKGLGDRIVKFFKDLYNWIKTLVSNQVGIEQLYSLIESNKIPAKFERNTQQLESLSPAFRIVDSGIQDVAFQKQIIDTISTVFKNEFNRRLEEDKGKPKNLRTSQRDLAQRLLGASELSKGSVAEYFLKHSMALNVNESYEYLPDDAFQALLQTKGDPVEVRAWKVEWQSKLKYDIVMTIPTELAFTKGLDGRTALPKTIHKKTTEEKNKIAAAFYNIWKSWFDVVDERTGNIEKFGWREAVVLNLNSTNYGYNFETRSKIKSELEDLTTQEETNYDKIYNLTHFEQSPVKTVSQEVRRAYSNILNTAPNVLGFDTYIDVEDAIRATIAVTIASQSFDDIVADIQTAAENFDVLKPIANHIKYGQMTAQDAAALTSFLNMVYTDQRIIQEGMSDEGNMYIRLINSDRKSSQLAWSTMWRGESISTPILERRTAVMKKDEKGNLSFNNNIIDGKTRLEHIKEALTTYNNDEKTFDNKIDAVADLMWYSSLGIGQTKETTRSRFRAHMQLQDPEDQSSVLQSIFGKIAGRQGLLKNVLNIVVEGNVVKPSETTVKEKAINFFESEGSTIKELAGIAAEFELPTAIAYVDGKGKTIYPYNLPTPFTKMLEDLKRGENSKHYLTMMRDQSLSMKFTDEESDSEDHQALMLHMIRSQKFEIESFSLDSISNEVLEDVSDYKDLSPRDSLIMRINMFLNDGQEFIYVPLPTQETRGRVDFLKLPRLSGIGNSAARSMKKAGIPYNRIYKAKTAQRTILSQIIFRDLVRLGLNPALAKEKNNNGFHLSGIVDTELPSGKLSQLAAKALQAKDKRVYQPFFDDVYAQVDNYLKTTYKDFRNELVNELVRYNIIKPHEEKEGVYVLPEGTRLDSFAKKFGGKDGDILPMLGHYMFNDLVARIEMAQMFYGGVQNFKDSADFYKRMGLINTPGTVFMQRGEFKGDPDYGMPAKINTATVTDESLGLRDPYHNEIAGKYKRRMLRYNIEQLSLSEAAAEEKAEAIRAIYSNDSPVERPDGQAWISPAMFSFIEQGLARWTKEDTVALKKYLAGEESWSFKYTPAYKFFFMQTLIVNGVLTPDLQKNAFIVLTKELAEGNPVLTAMYNNMIKNDIHVINSVSAKKGYKGKPFTVRPELGEAMFDGMEIEEMDTSGFVMPQLINYKEESQTKMNRQIRKTIPSMVDPQVTYNLSDGSTISGEDLLEEYHNLNRDIIEEQKQRLFEDLGWAKLKKDPSNMDLRLDFLKRIREIFYDTLQKNDKLDINTDTQFRIIENAAERLVDFNVPLDLPVYGSKFENLIYSLFKTNVYTIKMPGSELVQAAGPGTWNVTNTDGTVSNRELRHIDIDESTGEVISSEVLISQDIADKLGLKIGDEGLFYRIPNQDYSSIVPSRIAGILPNGYSKTVIVAGNIVIQTGSDFDVDKLFALFRRAAKSKVKKSSVSETRERVEAVDKIFEENPELAKIGTRQEYLQYLRTVFPNSTTQEILYHGASEKFDELKLSTENRASLTGSTRKGIYLTDDEKTANTYKVGPSASTISIITDVVKELEEALGLADHGLKEWKRVVDGATLIKDAEDFAERYDAGVTPESILGAFEEEYFWEGPWPVLTKKVITNLGVSVEEFLDLLRTNNVAEIKSLLDKYSKANPDTSRVIRVLANTTDPVVTTNTDTENILNALETIKDEIADAQSVIAKNVKDAVNSERPSTTTIIYDTKDTLILGSKRDQSNFAKSVKEGTKLAKTELAKIDENKNRLHDLSMAVVKNDATVPYLIAPLDTATLDILADDPVYSRGYSAKTVQFDSPLAEIKMEYNYKSSASLVGIYANGITGMNIALRAAEREKSKTGQGIIINAAKHFELNGVKLNELRLRSPFNNERTVAGVVERLSAALDAGSNLIHSSINDNRVTANVTVFLSSIGFTQEDIVALLTTPAVRKFVEFKTSNNKLKLKSLVTDPKYMGIDKTLYNAIVNNDVDAVPPPIKTKTLKSIIRKNEGRIFGTNRKGESIGKWESEAAKDAFITFVHAYVAGNSLSDFYKVIAADNLDGMGSVAEVSEYLDTLDNYKNNDERGIVGYSEVKKILEGDSYGTMKAFFQVIKESQELSSQLFMGAADSISKFKSDFKEATDKEKLNEREHRTIDRALSYYLLTKEGSPIAPLMKKDVVERMVLNPKTNLYSQVQDILEDIPSLRDNKMLSKIIKGPGFDNEVNRVWGIGIENTEKMTTAVRNKTIQDFEKLIYSPEEYTRGMENAEEENKRIQRLGARLVLFSIVTTGLAPSFGSYFTSIPIKVFTNFEEFLDILNIKRDENAQTLMQYVREESRKMKSDENYFNDFMFNFVQNYGTRSVAGVPLISRMMRGFVRESTSDARSEVMIPAKWMDLTEVEVPRFATRRNKGQGVDKISVYEFDPLSGKYYKIQDLGIGAKLLEMNLRDSDGKIIKTTHWNKSKGTKSDIVEVKNFAGQPKKVNLKTRGGITESRVRTKTNKKAKKRNTNNNDIEKKCNT